MVTVELFLHSSCHRAKSDPEAKLSNIGRLFRADPILQIVARVEAPGCFNNVTLVLLREVHVVVANRVKLFNAGAILEA